MIRQVVKANLILLIQYAVGSLIPLLLIPHIVGVIGLTEYGHLAVLMAWGGYGATIVQYSFHLTGPKRVMQLKPGEGIAVVFIDVSTAKMILLCFVILAILPIISYLPFESKSSYAWLILLIMPLAASSNSTWFLQSQDKFLSVCVLSIIGSAFTLIIGFNYIKQGYKYSVDVAVLTSILGSTLIGLCTFIIAATSARNPKFEINLNTAFKSLKDGWHLFISQFISVLYTASGPIIINYYLNSEAAGAYSVTERVMSALMAAALLTHTAAYPRLASAYIKDRPTYWRTIKIILIGYITATLIASIVIWTERNIVINFLYGNSEKDHSLLLFVGLLWFISGIFGVTLTGYLTVSGRSKAIWPLNLKILITSLLLGVIGLKVLGGIGWLVAIVAAQLINIHVGYKYWKLEYGL